MDRAPIAARCLPETVIVTRDGVPLQEGVDYRFSYDATSAVIRLTPLAGIWEPDHAYEIQLLNVDTLVITASSGELVADGDTFTVQDLNGQVATFEFESGYTIQVPAGGGASIIDGSTFTIKRPRPPRPPRPSNSTATGSSIPRTRWFATSHGHGRHRGQGHCHRDLRRVAGLDTEGSQWRCRACGW